MKTKIIAAVLAAVLLLHVGGEFTRAKASGAVAAAGSIIQIGIMAWHLLAVMTDNSQEISDGVNAIVDNAESISDSNDMFEFVAGATAGTSFLYDAWKLISETCSGWFDSGEITIDDNGKVFLKYSQYLELYDLVGSASADFDITMNTNYDYIAFKATPGVPFLINDSISVLPSSGCVDKNDNMFYVPIFYDDNSIFIGSSCLRIRFFDVSTDTSDLTDCYVDQIGFDVLNNRYTYTITHTNARNTFKSTEFFDSVKPVISADSLVISTRIGTNDFTERKLSWIEFDGISLTNCIDPDFSGKSFGYINFRRAYPIDFFKSITSYCTTLTYPDLDDLSDTLDPVLEKTTDPTLVIDTDPAIVNPIDSVIVTDIPGTNDVPLSQLKAKTNVDIDIPSLIADKFPFCIPFDFIRIISVLCADPVAPVFRIPISTNPENLEAFEGNQTIGDIPEDFKPMFDIDEEIVIDLSCIPLVQPICYTIFILGFVILLIYITPKMINH